MKNRKNPFKGVNLGNWLVLEKWMSPQMFDGTDAEDETWLNREASWKEIPEDSMWTSLPEEYAAYRQNGPMTREKLALRMKYHRETYVTEADFIYLKEHGITKVRIPVPYFIFGDREPYIGCVEYLDRAFVWAENQNMEILIDLHTAPGGQNGYDNGGITGVCKFGQDENEVVFVLSVLERLSERYGKEKALYGIEVLNEPISQLVWKTAPSSKRGRDPQEAAGSYAISTAFLKQFYKRAYWKMRKYLAIDKVIVFHDGFRLHEWGNFFVKSGFRNVALDAHLYIFGMENFVPVHHPGVYAAYLALCKARIAEAQLFTPVIVGEWCICNDYAFGVRKNFSKGALEEGIEIVEQHYVPDEPIPEEEKKRRFRLLQKMEYETWKDAEGWFYWNYQLQRDPAVPTAQYYQEAWDLHRCIERGWFEV